MKTKTTTTTQYFIKSKDGYYLTDHGSWSANEEQRWLMDFRTALHSIDEAKKWNPSAEIHTLTTPVIKRTTMNEARGTLVAFKMTISKRDGEYRVNFVGGVEATAYYTTDIDDAISTAQVMRGARTRNEQLRLNPLAEKPVDRTLYWHDVQLMRTSIPHWIAAYRIAKIAADQSALADSARQNMAHAMKQMITIGDKLTADLMPGCTTIAALVGKHADHGYRPTLRADAGRAYALLADVYDFYAEAHGLEVRAYRG